MDKTINFKNKKYLLFDMDGTIIDPKGGLFDSYRKTLAEFDIFDVPDSFLQKWIGPPSRDSFKKFYGFSDSDADLAVKKLREVYASTGKLNNVLYSGIYQLISQAKALDKKIILATSKPTPFAIEILEQHDLFKFFDFVGGANLDGSVSSKQAVISLSINALNFKPIDAVMIGDTVYDIQGAKAHNIHSIGVGYGYGDVQDLIDIGATTIATTMQDLQSLLI
jgi:phosphoglycolate phosphatase